MAPASLMMASTARVILDPGRHAGDESVGADPGLRHRYRDSGSFDDGSIRVREDPAQLEVGAFLAPYLRH